MKNVTILITGTSSGIGKKTAQYFAKRGWNVAATVRKNEDFFFENNVPNARNFLLDVSKEDQCRRVIADVIKTFGSLDVLVNNAGLSVMAAFEESSQQSIDDQFQTNLYGAMQLTKAALPYFRKQRSGLIVAVSSMAGRIGVPFYSIHAASKFALEGFFESLRFELYPFHIRVKIIEPGSYQTRILSNGKKYPALQIGNTYEPYLRKHEEGMQAYEVHRRDPGEVAEKIWEAVHDESNQLRYIVGEDAIHIEKMRKELSEEEIFSLVGKNFQSA